ncbi:MAG: type II secretion system secretin GspD [Alphaproteobacteria bacterium]|nr:type II secretion system secretin GspD [Alphaproteobacteria bacterium]
MYRVCVAQSLSRLLTALTLGVLVALGGCATRIDDLYPTKEKVDHRIMGDIMNADLSPRPPRRVEQEAIEDSAAELGPRDPELYHGRATRPGGALRGRRTARLIPATGEFELSFAGTKLADVVKVVLGEMLQEAFVLDPRVQGSVTMSTGRPVSRAEMISVLETIVQMNNGALVKEGGRYVIRPAGEAMSSTLGEISLARSGRDLPPGFGLTVLPLRHVSAKNMMQLLQGFAIRSGTVKAQIVSNMLLVKGTGQERRSFVEVALMFDVDWLRGQSAGLYPLAHTSPEEIIADLKQVFRNGQNAEGAGLIRFRPIDRLSAILVLTDDSSILEEVTTWVQRLDRANESKTGHYVYRVQNGKAVDLAAILNETFSDSSSERSPISSEVAPGGVVRARGALDRPDGSPPDLADDGADTAEEDEPRREPTRRRRPSATTAANGVRIVPDELNNTLIIRGKAKDYREIVSVLQRIDKAPLQVLIHATIAEVTLNNALRYGVQGFLRSSEANLGPDNGSVGVFDAVKELVLKPAFPGLNFILGSGRDPSLILDALSEVTEVKLVSSPSLVVLDNQTATLKVGDEVPITTQQVQSVRASEAPTVNSVEFRDTGVILKVTPRVSANGLVTMEIEQEVSNVAPNSEGAQTLTPTISQRRIASTIAVQSGQLVVLGGLISERRDKTKTGVPIINQVPILGDLLGSTDNNSRRTELIVFIGPKVIRNSREASEVAEALRSQLQSMHMDNPRRRRFERYRDSDIASSKD